MQSTFKRPKYFTISQWKRFIKAGHFYKKEQWNNLLSTCVLQKNPRDEQTSLSFLSVRFQFSIKIKVIKIELFCINKGMKEKHKMSLFVVQANTHVFLNIGLKILPDFTYVCVSYEVFFFFS